jgi:nucleoside-diphosphate-sugar epimerase
MRIGVTGCTSKIGENVCERIIALGFELFRIGRNESIKWEFGQMLPHLELDVLIHLAHDRDLQEREFRLATELLLSSVNRRTFLIYLSSTSAHSTSVSNYGKNKYIGENMFINANGIVLKSGLIFKNGELYQSGILGTIVQFIQKFAIIPLPYRGKNSFYLTEIDTLSRVIVGCAIDQSPGILRAFNPVAITFSDLIRKIAVKLAKKIRIIPVSDRLTNGLLLLITSFFGSKGVIDSFLSLSSEISESELGALIAPKIEFPDFNVS